LRTPRQASVFDTGSWEVDLARRELRRNGIAVPLGTRAFDIVEVLVQSAGELVTKDEIMRRVWSRAIVEESTLQVHISAIRQALGPDRGLLKTAFGRGYRLTGSWTVREDSRPMAQADTEPMLPRPDLPSQPDVAPVTRERAHADNALADGPALPDKPSLAVLPFQNLTGDAEQEYFVDGMVEEITTAIARLPWLFVIARNSAFTYKGKAVGVKQVAQELGVRYVRKAGNRVRITGQLIDTATDAHIWADRFDGALDDIFELQDQVGSGVAGAIEPKLRQSEIERASRKPIANLTAYDLYLRALAQSYCYTEEGLAEAVVLARQALTIDPSYAPAAAMVGLCRVLQRIQGWGALSEEDIREACRLARQALEAARDDADTIWQVAWTLFYLAGEAAMAAAALDRALALNPNAAHAWLMRGLIHAVRSQPEAAIEAIERARRLSPFDPYTFLYALYIALAHFAARRFEQAIEWADRALHEQPRMVATIRTKIAANAHLGRLDEARAELSRLLAIDPKLTIAGYRAYAHFAAPEVLELLVTGLRLAGLPEE
jgi:TolB-like protein/Tfp pilus assembly protein PilF